MTDTPVFPVFSRRAVLGGSGVLLTSLALSACSSSGSATDSASKSGSDNGDSSTGAKETKLRDNSGYHLNDLTEGAPTVTLYTDMQCPYCKRGEPAYEEAAGKLAGVMNVTVRHFPLPMHQWAVHGAVAVQAAENQGKHLAMADKVFDQQETWETAADNTVVYDYFESYAKELGLDLEKFKADYESQEVMDVVKADYEAGQKVEVSGTPQFVVEGTKLEDVDSATSADDMVAAFKKAAGL